ncbi:MAG TPA: hypothetical protein VKB60_10675, partial [Terriglobales bacterium]|nr:hypothetical protein [Terriglobales bacterium]
MIREDSQLMQAHPCARRRTGFRLSSFAPGQPGGLPDDPQVGQLQRLAPNLGFGLHPVFEIVAILTAAQLEQFKCALADAF